MLNPIWGECLRFSNIEDSGLLFQVKSSRFGLQRLIKREKLHGAVYLKTSEIPVQGIEGCFKLLKKDSVGKIQSFKEPYFKEVK